MVLAKVKEDTSIVDFSNGTLTYIDVNFDEYRRKIDTRTVRKNVSLPFWLNYEAEKAGVNVSENSARCINSDTARFKEIK